MFNFGRRINRATYFAGIAASILGTVGVSMLAELPEFGTAVDMFIGLFILFAALVLLVYSICLMRQRANDIGWHPLLLTLLAFWTPLFLVLGLIPGQRSYNKFGPAPPKGVRLR